MNACAKYTNNMTALTRIDILFFYSNRNEKKWSISSRNSKSSASEEDTKNEFQIREVLI